MSLPLTPDQLLPELFYAVQRSGLYQDSKTFVDLIPVTDVEQINHAFQNACIKTNVQLQAFIDHYFVSDPLPVASDITKAHNAVDHVTSLWPVLTRQADDERSQGSRLPLIQPYVVPGGRFNEIYYWDSYFTQLGLAVSGEQSLITSMVDNFTHLIDQLGCVPNGNRSYFTTRSQPPFFALMVDLLASIEGDDIFKQYLPAMLREYSFWMEGVDSLQPGECHRRVVMTELGALNRYWDDADTPRQESFVEDEETAKLSGRSNTDVYRDLRAGAESGWDFSSRWFTGVSLDTIATTSIIPIDLNALLVKVEQIISNAANIAGLGDLSDTFALAAKQRSLLINQFFFNEPLGAYVDINWPSKSHRESLTLASIFPLYAGVASSTQASVVANTLRASLLKEGGWMTTDQYSGEQWDAPNGWAPLQWIMFDSLSHYGFDALAKEGAQRWIDNVESVYKQHGKMLEKYDVVTVGNIAGGGEYAVQDGFGWTNGVYLKLLSLVAD